MNLATLGLVIIALGWLVQMVFYYRGKKEIRKDFVGLYMLGIILLLVDDYANSGMISVFDLVALVFAGAIFFKGCCCGRKKQMNAPKSKKRRR